MVSRLRLGSALFEQRREHAIWEVVHEAHRLEVKVFSVLVMQTKSTHVENVPTDAGDARKGTHLVKVPHGAGLRVLDDEVAVVPYLMHRYLYAEQHHGHVLLAILFALPPRLEVGHCGPRRTHWCHEHNCGLLLNDDLHGCMLSGFRQKVKASAQVHWWTDGHAHGRARGTGMCRSCEQLQEVDFSVHLTLPMSGWDVILQRNLHIGVQIGILAQLGLIDAQDLLASVNANHRAILADDAGTDPLTTLETELDFVRVNVPVKDPVSWVEWSVGWFESCGKVSSKVFCLPSLLMCLHGQTLDDAILDVVWQWLLCELFGCCVLHVHDVPRPAPECQFKWRLPTVGECGVPGKTGLPHETADGDVLQTWVLVHEIEKHSKMPFEETDSCLCTVWPRRVWPRGKCTDAVCAVEHFEHRRVERHVSAHALWHTLECVHPVSHVVEGLLLRQGALRIGLDEARGSVHKDKEVELVFALFHDAMIEKQEISKVRSSQATHAALLRLWARSLAVLAPADHILIGLVDVWWKVQVADTCLELRNRHVVML